METADTASLRRPPALRPLFAGLIAALWACTPAKSQAPLWEFAACDPSEDYERCDADDPGLRWRCVSTTAVWQSIGYCPQFGVCVAAPLPIDATAGQGTACQPRPADASGSTDLLDSGGPPDSAISTDLVAKDGAIGGLCGNGICDQQEAGGGCPSDCAKPVCGDGQCLASEQGLCAYDCEVGAAAAVSCALALCPGAALQCKAKPGCLVALAELWACSQQCAGCLTQCLQASPADAAVFAVASCGAPSCF